MWEELELDGEVLLQAMTTFSYSVYVLNSKVKWDSSTQSVSHWVFGGMGNANGVYNKCFASCGVNIDEFNFIQLVKN